MADHYFLTTLLVKVIVSDGNLRFVDLNLLSYLTVGVLEKRSGLWFSSFN